MVVGTQYADFSVEKSLKDPGDMVFLAQEVLQEEEVYE
jgi:hypothetical protein